MALLMLPKEEIVAATTSNRLSLSNLNEVEIGLLRKLKDYDQYVHIYLLAQFWQRK